MTSSNLDFSDMKGILEDFRDFYRVDLQLFDRTVRDHVWKIGRFLKSTDVDVNDLSTGKVRYGYMKFSEKENYTLSSVVLRAGLVKTIVSLFVGCNICFFVRPFFQIVP